MLSRTSEYALRALIYLTQNEADWPISGSRIAAEAEVPPNYLRKVLGDLVRAGVLQSSPGKTGGFWLNGPATDITLLAALGSFERFEHRRCPFGNQVCSDVNPCNAHSQWSNVIEVERKFLEKTTLADIAGRMSKGRGTRKK